jgi:hypothetical protein
VLRKSFSHYFAAEPRLGRLASWEKLFARRFWHEMAGEARMTFASRQMTAVWTAMWLHGLAR